MFETIDSVCKYINNINYFNVEHRTKIINAILEKVLETYPDKSFQDSLEILISEILIANNEWKKVYRSTPNKYEFEKALIDSAIRGANNGIKIYLNNTKEQSKNTRNQLITE